jgi:hypothetical protein
MTLEELQKQLQDLETKVKKLQDSYYRVHFIDKDVFTNPVIAHSLYLKLITFKDTTGDEYLLYPSTIAGVAGLELEGDLWVDGELIADGRFRINQTPTTEVIVPDKTIVISVSGTNYKVPIKAA